MFALLRRRFRAAMGAPPPPARTPSAVPRVGIGSAVLVTSPAGADDPWEGEPSGVVIGPGGNDIVGYPGLHTGGSRSWLVAFDEMAWMRDGRGPFEHATIAAWRLVAAPFADEFE